MLQSLREYRPTGPQPSLDFSGAGDESLNDTGNSAIDQDDPLTYTYAWHVRPSHHVGTAWRFSDNAHTAPFNNFFSIDRRMLFRQ
jgi:hypothetical protein